MNKTLTREEIEEIFLPITDGHDGKEYYDFDKEMGDTIKSMALNSIPKTFDAKDDRTFPPESGLYITWSGSRYITEKRWDKIEKEWWATTHVTHWLPIPEVGEE